MLPYLITYFCLGSVDPQYIQACNQGLTAAAIQIHLTEKVNLLQQNIETEIEKRTGRDIWVGVLTTYKVYTTETMVFNTNAKPIADSVSGSIGKQGTSLTLTWMF